MEEKRSWWCEALWIILVVWFLSGTYTAIGSIGSVSHFLGYEPKYESITSLVYWLLPLVGLFLIYPLLIAVGVLAVLSHSRFPFFFFVLVSLTVAYWWLDFVGAYWEVSWFRGSMLGHIFLLLLKTVVVFGVSYMAMKSNAFKAKFKAEVKADNV